ncbi:MAG: hypothetical protein ACKVP4_09375 [Hyphomicrobium sp.]
MRRRHVPRRLYAVVMSGICLSGCANLLAQSVELPTPTNINDYIGMFEPFATGPILTGSDYVWAGYAYSDHHCNNYFSALEKSKMQASFIKDTTASAFAAANTFMSLASTSQKALGIVAAAGSFVGNVMTSYNNEFFFAQHSGALWNQVVIAQNQYKFHDVVDLYDSIKANPISNVTTAAVAHNIVQNYARLCTLQQLDLFVSTALTTRSATASDGPGAGGGKGGAKESVGGGRSRSYGRGPSMPSYVIQ